jgi:hypothetical protein
MELKDRDTINGEILQSWLKSAWIYPEQDDNGSTYLRLTPGGRLKFRSRIGEFESSTGMGSKEAAEQDEAGTLPVERDKLELAMMAQAYTSERRLMESTGHALGSSPVDFEGEGEG